MSPLKMRRSRLHEGLTLVELLIVSALLLILASLALGSLKSLLKGQKVSQAAVTVRQFVQNAQMRAVSTGRPVAVFFDRVSMLGSDPIPPNALNIVGKIPTPQNFTATRLQLGEVFPPYTGDFENSHGRLVDIDSLSNVNQGYADTVIFSPSSFNDTDNVKAGLGYVSNSNLIAGFISVGDIIELDGCEAHFSITTIGIAPSSFPAGSIAVSFANAEVVQQQLPLDGSVTYKRFRIFRQPTKSMVGAIALPRGTCVDMSLSGVGIRDSAVQGGTFGLSAAPQLQGTPTVADSSRLAIVFNSDGRVAYVIDENSMRSPRRVFHSASSLIYLLVGRTEQVLPGFHQDGSSLLKISLSAKLAAIQHPDYGNSDLPQSNLVDPENIWVTCNPLTGEIKSCPVKGMDATSAYSSINSELLSATPANISIQNLITETRSLAAAGVNN